MMVRMRIRMRGARSKLSSKVMAVRLGEGSRIQASDVMELERCLLAATSLYRHKQERS
jgi:hypothetical protein